MDILAEGLSKSYNGQQVLKDFNARFPEGEVSCIMGVSGCGKTTLLRILLRLEMPDAGSVLGVPYGKLGAVFQEDRLCENLSVVTNLRFACGHGRTIEEIRKAMSDLKLEEAYHKPVRELSGGMKRRAALLRAVLAENTCIVMDEPFSGLDGETRELAAAYIRKYTAGRTLLVVTHEPGDIGLLRAGQVLRM